MKAIMISIKPKWVADILNGRKTIEIRKTMPKCDFPIDVYIYCSKGSKKDWHLIEVVDTDTGWKGYEYDYLIGGGKDDLDYCLEGKVVAKFTLNKVEEITVKKWNIYVENNLLEESCLHESELFHYIGDFRKKPFYTWHIDNLEIFDKPKELSEFLYNCRQNHKDFPHCNKCCKSEYCWDGARPLTKAPQNFCYVEVE